MNVDKLKLFIRKIVQEEVKKVLPVLMAEAFSPGRTSIASTVNRPKTLAEEIDEELSDTEQIYEAQKRTRMSAPAPVQRRRITESAPAPVKKKPVTEKQFVHNNPMLNAILNETAANFRGMPSDMARPEAVNSIPVGPATLNENRTIAGHQSAIAIKDLPETLHTALTRDYSSLVKAMNKKKSSDGSMAEVVGTLEY